MISVEIGGGDRLPLALHVLGAYGPGVPYIRKTLPVVHPESAFRSGVGMARAVSGSGLRTNAAVPSRVAPLSDSRGP